MPEEAIDAKIRIEVDGAKELKKDKKKEHDKRGKEVLQKESKRQTQRVQKSKQALRKKRGYDAMGNLMGRAGRRSGVTRMMGSMGRLARAGGPLAGGAAALGAVAAFGGLARKVGFGPGAYVEGALGIDLSWWRRAGTDVRFAFKQLTTPFGAVTGMGRELGGIRYGGEMTDDAYEFSFKMQATMDQVAELRKELKEQGEARLKQESGKAAKDFLGRVGTQIGETAIDFWNEIRDAAFPPPAEVTEIDLSAEDTWR